MPEPAPQFTVPGRISCRRMSRSARCSSRAGERGSQKGRSRSSSLLSRSFIGPWRRSSTSRLPSSVTASARWSLSKLARHRRRQSEVQPVRLFVSADRAPQLARRDRPIHALPEAEFLAELRRLNGTPGALSENVELMAIMLPILRADFVRLRNQPLRGRAAARLRHFRLRRLTGSAGQPRRSRSLARSNQCFLLVADVSRRPFLPEHDAATSP